MSTRSGGGDGSLALTLVPLLPLSLGQSAAAFRGEVERELAAYKHTKANGGQAADASGSELDCSSTFGGADMIINGHGAV